MSILVAGGAGFIGSQLCEALLSKNYQVTGFDNPWLDRMENIARLKDIAKFCIVRGIKIDLYVLHLLFEKIGEHQFFL